MPKATWEDVEGSPWEDELDDISIYDGEMPPKGVYRLRLKMLRLKKNKNGEPMINGLVIVNEPTGSKKVQYNGYDTWLNLNVTSQGSRWVNNFLAALAKDDKQAAVLRKAFWDKKVMVDKNDPPNILSIGGVKITENMLVTAQLAFDSYGEGAMKPKRFMRPTDFKLNEDDGFAVDDEDGDDDEEWESEEGTEEEPEEDGDDPEFDARVQELEAMSRNQLLKAAKDVDVTVKRGTPENDIIDAILAEEFPAEEEEPGEEEEEELAEEEPEEEEEPEPEPEPEPEKPAARRRRPAAKAASPAPAKEEEPARTRTGTRRRKAAGGGNPPF